MGLPGRIERLIQPSVEALGFEIVRVQLTGQKRRRLQVMIERLDGKAVMSEDCAEISRDISTVLDVENPMEGAFTLEVSSPGIDRPLVRLDDFERFSGYETKVEMKRPIYGRRKFKGRLIGLKGEDVQVLVDGEPVSLPYQDIQKAKLVMSNELLVPSEEL
ncbi:MAG: ribosome maturation factor RimP [Rhodospirillales bacterium]